MSKSINFKEYPDFKPNITPREMFLKWVFGGYWRTIYSNVANKNIKNDYKKYDNLYNIPNNSNYNDYTISPKIRQVLLEWGYGITKKT